ncbi:hypothetical protein OBV_07780 [Oscillibacter valericigenes Sjm18-20]|nr:hypothetical protein OBV_07780 [Oscillibacter valericigenes Sjm18-20]
MTKIIYTMVWRGTRIGGIPMHRGIKTDKATPGSKILSGAVLLFTVEAWFVSFLP